MASRFNVPRPQVSDANGVPLPGAKLYFYAAGTSTPLATYADPALSVVNLNPVSADAAGRFPDIWLGDSEYKCALHTAEGVPIWTADPLRPDTGAALRADLANASDAVKGDALIGVRRSATGATATTLHAWLERQAFNVQSDFGAIPYLGRYDTAFASLSAAVADSSPAIQAAIDAAYSVGGGVVFIPAGIYRLDAAIKPRPGVTVMGVAPYTPARSGVNYGTMLWASGNFPCISHIGTQATYTGTHDAGILNNFALENLSLHGQGRTNPACLGVDFKFWNRCSFSRVHAFACYAGFKSRNAWQCDISACHVHGGEGQRSYIGFWNAESDYENSTGIVNNAIIYSNCVAANCQFAAYYLQHPQGSKMVNCEAPAGNGCMFGMLLGDLSAAKLPNPNNGGVLTDNVSEFFECTGSLFDTIDGYGVVALNRWYNGSDSEATRNLARFFHFSNCWIGNIGMPYRDQNGDTLINATDAEYAARDYVASRLGTAAANVASGNAYHFYAVGYCTIQGGLVATTAKHGVMLDQCRRITIGSGLNISRFAQVDATAAAIRCKDSNTILLSGNQTFTTHTECKGLSSDGASDYIAYGGGNNWHNGVSLVGSNNTTGNLTTTGVLF